MAKRMNGTWKIVMWAAGGLVTAGALCATIYSNERRINKVEVSAMQNEKDIVELKTDVKYIRSGIDDIKHKVYEGETR
jgi:hypothetical protein